MQCRMGNTPFEEDVVAENEYKIIKQKRVFLNDLLCWEILYYVYCNINLKKKILRNRSSCKF